MNTSEHYGLNLAEGSDIFNPLVTDVPNFEIIDSAMYAIDQKAIGIATELVSGTVHALTRQGDGDVFRFVATGNAKAGDTYTVDGQQVSALLPTGETLGDGAYVINATVICALNGTVLTFYLGGGTVEEAEDSKKLGGQLPSYYGTAAAVASANQTASAAQQIAIGIQSAVEAAQQTAENAKSAADGYANYSTGESVCGTWIDGSPIYRKVVAFGNLPNNSIKSVAHGITELKHAVSVRGICWGGDGSDSPIPFVSGKWAPGMIDLYVNATNVVITTSYDRSAETAYVIIEYLKN